MRLARAFCSLSHPSSAFEPSHPPNSVGFSLCTVSLTSTNWSTNIIYRAAIIKWIMTMIPMDIEMDPSGLSNGSCYHDTRIRTRGLRLSFFNARAALYHWATGPLFLEFIRTCVPNISWLFSWFKYFFMKIKKIKKNKGGDPAAGSPTATLWRLNPPRWA